MTDTELRVLLEMITDYSIGYLASLDHEQLERLYREKAGNE